MLVQLWREEMIKRGFKSPNQRQAIWRVFFLRDYLNLLVLWLYFFIGGPKLIGQLGKSWIFLIHVIWKAVGWNWRLVKKRKEWIFCWSTYVVIYAPSHTNTHTVRSSPTAKKEIRRFQNGLFRELKVTEERKLLRQSKTLCLNRRHQFVQSEDHTSYMEKGLGKGMCITFKMEEIWTIEEDCSKSNSKEKEV